MLPRALTVAVVALACGCTSHAAGHPQFAGTLSTPTDLPTGGGIDGPTDSPSESPSESPSDSGSPSASGTLSPEEIADKICRSATATQLKRIFGGPVQVEPGLAYQCGFRGENAGVLIYEFPSSSLTEAIGEADDPHRTTIAGHPAVVDGKFITVGEAISADDPGILRAMVSFGQPAVATKLLQQILPAFEH
ncbi:MAG TPA: hypothetical protein VHC49_23460 [Mycobacteriales bacterium]|nr:hypothetical protein [Mycobacteriales bacterium]